MAAKITGFRYFMVGADKIPDWFNKAIEDGTARIETRNGKIQYAEYLSVDRKTEKVYNREVVMEKRMAKNYELKKD